MHNEIIDYLYNRLPEKNKQKCHRVYKGWYSSIRTSLIELKLVETDGNTIWNRETDSHTKLSDPNSIEDAFLILRELLNA